MLFLNGGLYIYSQENIVAKITTKIADNLVDINAFALNSQNTFKDDYSYLLFSLKKGENGNYSRNSQSGKFSIEANQEKKLASLKINIQKGEECKVFLFIRKEGLLISKDSTVIYSAESTKQKKYVPENEMEINGLVIEDVKTKLGKDFYDYFYQKYLASSVKFPFIINIDEKPSIGRGSRISIKVDDRTIFEFLTKPNDEYIQMAANQAIRYIYSYSTQRKLLYKNKNF